MQRKVLVAGFLYERNRVLLLKRSEDKELFAGHYERPGGHKEDSDKTLEAAIKREFKEEAGLDITVGPRYHHYIQELEGVEYTEYSYLVSLATPDQQVQVSDEHEHHKWVRKDDLHFYQIDKNEKEAILKGFQQLKVR